MFVIYRDSPYLGHGRTYIRGFRRALDGATMSIWDARGYKTRTGAQRTADKLNARELNVGVYTWRVRKRPVTTLDKCLRTPR